MPVSLGGKKPGQFDTSTGLYNFAYDNGLREQADMVIARHSGEEYKKIFSGGTISDIFDVLSLDGYGVVGMLKGQSFMDGVKNRESFADADSLGRYGLVGAAVGILADIVVSPTTYITPFKVFTKVPGLKKIATQGKEALFGKMVEKVTPEGKKFMQVEGGTGVGRYVADKLVWMNGQDPVYREAFEKFQRDLGVGVAHAQRILKPIARLDEKTAQNLLVRDETGRFSRRKLTELENMLSAEDFAKVKPVWDEMDRLGQELVDLGVLGKNKYEENLGEYIKNAYLQYEKETQGKFFASKATGIKGGKARKEGLTEEGMKKLGQIDDPAYLAFRSLMEMNRDVANAKLFKEVNRLFATTKETPGFAKIPDTKRFQTNVGKISEIKLKIKDANKAIKPLVASIKKGLSKDKKFSKMLKSLDKQYQAFVKEGTAQLDALQNVGVTAPGKQVTKAEAKADLKKMYNDLLKTSKEARKIIKKSEKVKGERADELAKLIQFEQKLSDFNFKKDDLIGELEFNKMGQLAGKYIPEKMMEYLDEIIEPTADNIGNKIMAEFKFSKVVLSPATHVRNILSNMVLNWWKLGMHPLRADRYITALREAMTDSPMYRRAQKAGLGASSYASQELRGLLDDPAMRGMSKTLGTKWAKVKQVIGDIYQFEEDVAKFAAFKEMIRRGYKDDEAWKLAEAATFNYAQVTPFVRKMRTAIYGAPFITFAVKSVPATLEAVAKTPRRVDAFARIKTAFEEQSNIQETEEEKAAMPEWMREGYFMKLPGVKDEYGRSAYFDMTYIIPFSTMVTGSVDVARILSGEKAIGGGSLGQELGTLTPALQTLSEIARNEDFLGNKIMKTTDTPDQQIADLAMYLAKVFAPPAVAANIPVGYDKDGNRKYPGIMDSLTMEEDPRMTETLPQELASYLGVKLRPFDVELQESINEYNRKEELKRLLIENGYGREFGIFYDPDKPKKIKE